MPVVLVYAVAVDEEETPDIAVKPLLNVPASHSTSYETIVD